MSESVYDPISIFQTQIACNHAGFMNENYKYKYIWQAILLFYAIYFYAATHVVVDVNAVLWKSAAGKETLRFCSPAVQASSSSWLIYRK